MTVVVTSKNELVVPKSIRRKAGIKMGDRVEFQVSGRVINIIPKLPYAEDQFTPGARREINQGKFVTLAELEHDLARKLHRDAAKRLEAIPPDRRERILADIRGLAEDPFRGLVRPLKGRKFKGLYRKVLGRYRTIFEPIFATHTAQVLAMMLRNEGTYR